MNKILIISALVIFTFGYAVYHALKLDNKLSSNNSFYSSNSVLQELPEVQIPRFFGEGKVNFRKLAVEGNDLIVHFWATWCGPCEKEFPDLVELTEKVRNRKDLKFLFVTVGDKEKDVKKFLKKYKIDKNSNFEILRDDEFLHQKYFGTYKLPETYLFDDSFKLLRKFSGPQEWADPAYVDMILSM